MVTIRTVTWVDAPVERCFRLATSIDFRLVSSKSKDIKVIAGAKSGLLEQGDMVTWPGKMFGLGRIHTVRVDVLRPFSYIHETMVEGGFLVYEHERHFAAMDDGTRIRDEVRFSTRWGLLGRVKERLLLRHRVAGLLQWRNEVLKEVAESEGWKRFLEKGSAVERPNVKEQIAAVGAKADTKSQFVAHQRATLFPK